MKATVLKRDERYRLKNDRSLGIQSFGEENDYPQRVIEIVAASGTGGACVDVYSKFISGKGFADKNLYKLIVNDNRQTADYLLNQVSKDFSFGCFVVHVNYNANYQIVEIQHVPWETVRFAALDQDTGKFNKVAIHPDWGKRQIQLRKWKKTDIEFIDLYDPDPLEIERQVQEAGGWDNYKGQILYFSNMGEKVYPLPCFDSVLTDMNTEEGIANVSNRNARNNFLSAGMLIDKVQDNGSAASDRDSDNRHRDDQTQTEKALKEFQGDEKACKIMYVQIETGEEKPEFVSFKGANYDKEFNVTLESSQSNIGKRFNQPPILRAEDVGSNFGADMMKNAYDYYNSVTENERLELERVFTELFSHWYETVSTDCAIDPLTYDVEMTLADRLGNEQLKELISVLNDKTLLYDQKVVIVKTIFGLSDDEANSLIPKNPAV